MTTKTNAINGIRRDNGRDTWANEAFDIISTAHGLSKRLSGGVYGAFIGTARSMLPSGAWYSPLGYNVVHRVTISDTEFIAMLEHYAVLYGGWIEQGFGDAGDWYFCFPHEP